MKNFDVVNVPLTSSNLIEASAGTGKTFSISILMLRFIIEKGYLPHQLVLVTFTNVAVAEIDGRVRELLQFAYRMSLKEIPEAEDELVASLLLRASKEHTEEEVIRRLKLANLAIDDAWICTIHSFCQRILTEFSFETNQMFGVSFVTSEQEMMGKVVHQFWRDEIVSLPKDVLKEFLAQNISPSYFSSVLSNALQDKEYIAPAYKEVEDGIEAYRDSFEDIDAIEETCIEYITSNLDTFLTNFGSYKGFKGIDDTDFFLSIYYKKFCEFKKDSNKNKYIGKKDNDLLALVEDYDLKKEQNKYAFSKLVATLNHKLIKKGKEHIDELKNQFSVMNHNDLLTAMWNASLENKEVLRDLLQRKFRAVFVDEFQDTDKAQYEIFNNLFGQGDTTLFYIGDPKQSIYSFRKADLNTYKIAKKGVEYIYSMDTNYRSTPELIEALNCFYKPNEAFDTFLDKEIEYQEVSAGKKGLGNLTLDGLPTKAISINPYMHSGEPKLESVLVAQIIEVLEKGMIDDRKVKPSDIGILVRDNETARKIKKVLAKQGVPSVTIDETKVLSSPEVNYLLYLLEATAEPSVRTINKAMLSQYHNIGLDELEKLDELETVQFFLDAKNEYEQKGVFKLIHFFVQSLGLSESLNNKGILGKRSLVNIFHLAELLHQQEKRNKASLMDLVGWLQKTSQDDKIEGDEFVQRIESDEQAVQIVTIHKSKGLAYNIIFAPQLNKKPFGKYGLGNMSSFLENGEYVFTDNPNEEQQQLIEFSEQQENRRLLYVALTRAVYKCYVYYKKIKELSPEVLINPFVIAQQDIDHPQIEITDSEVVELVYTKPIRTRSNVVRFQDTSLSFFELNKWKLLSFSAINTTHQPYSFLVENPKVNEYDEFIFNRLTKGALTGDFLHLLFERSDFTKPAYFDQTLEKVSLLYESIYDEVEKPNYIKLFEEVTQAKMPFGAGLNQVESSKRLNELKFHYPINDFKLSQLVKAFPEVNAESNVNLQGMMNGFIDLFFEYEGKYYVLDWKSNSLGNSLESYTDEHLVNAMNDNGYTLQGLIYSYASCLYLKSKIPGFDIDTQFGGFIYVFLRGARRGESTGVFHRMFNDKEFEKLKEVMG